MGWQDEEEFARWRGGRECVAGRRNDTHKREEC